MKKMNKLYTFYVEITKNCNLSCPFCPSSNVCVNYNMSFENFITVIDKIKPYIKLLYLHVLGEPTLHPEFTRIIKYCKNEKIDIALTTNGTLLTEFKDLLLEDDMFTKINISLQSLIQFNIKEQEEYLNKLISFLKEHSKKESKVPINLRLWNDKTDSNTIVLNDLILNKLEKYINCQNNVRLSTDDEFIWPSTSHSMNNTYSGCLGGKKQLAILNNGDIVLCCLDYEGKTKLGNIFKDNLEEILNSKLFLKVIEGFNNRKPIFDLCKKCTFRNRFE